MTLRLQYGMQLEDSGIKEIVDEKMSNDSSIGFRATHNRHIRFAKLLVKTRTYCFYLENYRCKSLDERGYELYASIV